MMMDDAKKGTVEKPSNQDGAPGDKGIKWKKPQGKKAKVKKRLGQSLTCRLPFLQGRMVGLRYSKVAGKAVNVIQPRKKRADQDLFPLVDLITTSFLRRRANVCHPYSTV